MSGWDNFFIAEVGASAALTGLIFVSVSINLTRILSLSNLPERALQALAVLLAILIIASMLLVPGQPLWLNGLEILLAGLIVWSLITTLDIINLRNTDARYRRKVVITMIISQLALLPYLIAGIVILTGSALGLYFVAASIVLSFFKAVMDAWVLLIEINR